MLLPINVQQKSLPIRSKPISQQSTTLTQQTQPEPYSQHKTLEMAKKDDCPFKMGPKLHHYKKNSQNSRRLKTSGSTRNIHVMQQNQIEDPYLMQKEQIAVQQEATDQQRKERPHTTEPFQHEKKQTPS